MLCLNRFLIIGMAATLTACITDPTTEDTRVDLDLGATFDTDAGVDGGCQAPTRLDLTLDQSTISTELSTSNTITVSLTGADGFGGTATLSATILDPQGKAIEGALKSLGVDGVASVRQGKVFDIELDGADAKAAEAVLKDAADKLLAGLVPSEIFPDAPTEALRAQAIAALAERRVPAYAVVESWEEEDFRRRFADQLTLTRLQGGPVAKSEDGELRVYALSGEGPQALPAIVIPRNDSGCVDGSPAFMTPGAVHRLER